jgi:hypothetical protein
MTGSEEVVSPAVVCQEFATRRDVVFTLVLC